MIKAGGFFNEKNVSFSGASRGTAFREVQVILTGKRRAVIENYRNIQSYTREEILILTPSGRLVIRGKNLVIPCYTTLELCIRGQIESITLEEGNK